jgi:hypothetical protein
MAARASGSCTVSISVTASSHNRTSDHCLSHITRLQIRDQVALEKPAELKTIWKDLVAVATKPMDEERCPVSSEGLHITLHSISNIFNEGWKERVDVTKLLDEDENPLTTQSGVDDNGTGEELNTEDLQSFSNVLNATYGAEAQFDKALFITLKNCLSRHNLIVEEQPVLIVPQQDNKLCDNTAGQRAAFDEKIARPDLELKVEQAGTITEDHDEAAGQASPEPIVFTYGLPTDDVTANPRYAIGIARQANGEHHSSGKSDGRTSSSLAANGKLNHCSCLLKQEKRGGKWTVVKCFSNVELKIGLEKDRIAPNVENGEVQSLNPQSGKGVIYQALMYTWEWMISSHGEVEELKDLPWAAIIGKMKKKNEIGGSENLESVGEDGEKGGDAEAEDDAEVAEAGMADIFESEKFGEGEIDAGKARELKAKKSRGTPSVNLYRWVSGDLLVPEKCGDNFEYSVTGCGDLEENDDFASIKGAISVYLDTLLFGLRAAKAMLTAINQDAAIGPYPTSGKHLMFGDVELEDMKLRGKPHIGTRLLRNNDTDDERSHWRASQGEIFTGRLNFHRLDELLVWKDDIVIFNKDDEEVSVVVKVSALSVHKFLNHPAKAWRAIETINKKYEEYETIKATHKIKTQHEWDGKNELETKWDLFNVLFAAEKMENALITIMADLSADYEGLTPSKHDLKRLWAAFDDLVTRVLLPLADMNIIHPDIRPGSNFTSNILYIKEGKGQCTIPSMQLIDFDSLVMFGDWSPPLAYNFKYIKKRENWTSHAFLWWQCVTLAYAWTKKIDQKTMETVDVTKKSDEKFQWSSFSVDNICAQAKVKKLRKNEFIAAFAVLSDTVLENATTHE